jgi:hypothetical protein
MSSESESDLFSPISDLGFARLLLADLHDDLAGKVARCQQLADLSTILGSNGAMLPGGEITYSAWSEARASFIHGNFVATVLLAQGLAEHVLAGHLDMALGGEELPERINFKETLKRCSERGVISARDTADLKRLMDLRNPLSHYRSINDPSNLSRRVLTERIHPFEQLKRDATFAISMAVRLLALPAFRVDG